MDLLIYFPGVIIIGLPVRVKTGEHGKQENIELVFQSRVNKTIKFWVKSIGFNALKPNQG